MKLSLALLAIVLLTLDVTGCGGTSRGAGSTSRVSSNPSATPALRSLKGDEDDDETAGNYTSNRSNDNDDDYGNVRRVENEGYYDSDDSSILTYGHAASVADRRAITALVERYYAAAAAEDGAKACSMITSTFATAIPEDYGQAPGPAYLRGAGTCQAVMSRLLKHVHRQLPAAIKVTEVRVGGNQARALLGSRTTPASFILVERERGTWKIDGLLGGPLP
jgi:hypothetical protein